MSHGSDRPNLGKKMLFSSLAARIKPCLEPTYTCANTAIRAHSVQNAAVMDLLHRKGHVKSLTVNRSNADRFELIWADVGRNRATTFEGFCSEHDAALFAPIIAYHQYECRVCRGAQRRFSTAKRGFLIAIQAWKYGTCNHPLAWLSAPDGFLYVNGTLTRNIYRYGWQDVENLHLGSSMGMSFVPMGRLVGRDPREWHSTRTDSCMLRCLGRAAHRHPRNVSGQRLHSHCRVMGQFM